MLYHLSYACDSWPIAQYKLLAAGLERRKVNGHASGEKCFQFMNCCLVQLGYSPVWWARWDSNPHDACNFRSIAWHKKEHYASGRSGFSV
jgi:hypothetical protein